MPSSPVTHRSVLAIAVPIMLSNVTEPLIGVVNTAVIGQLPEPYYIGAIALGALIFTFMYWGLGFLKMGTSGLSAQAQGAGDASELAAVLVRALLIAVTLGLGLIAIAPAIGALAFRLLEGSAAVEFHAQRYFMIRMWSAPFALINFCLLGWFIGQAKARIAFGLQLYLNLSNIALNLFFVMGLGMTSEGVALGTLIAEITAALLGLIPAWLQFKRLGLTVNAAAVLDGAKLKRMIAINRDIMIRTLCLIFAFAWFTARGAKSGDVALAANTVLLHFFEVAAFLIDGFAYASEALIGQAIGARDKVRFEAALRITWVWALSTGALCSGIILALGPYAIDLMSVDEGVRAAARTYLPWAALSPLVGCISFQYDGIYSGATQTADMRNMMIVSLIIFLGAWALLEPAYGLHGLWAALIVFFIARGVTFGLRMPALRRRAFA